MLYGYGTSSEFRYLFGGLNMFGSPIWKGGFTEFVQVARGVGQLELKIQEIQRVQSNQRQDQCDRDCDI